jgi:GDP-4-dehydro-6-deoxy-D-mannose reductase
VRILVTGATGFVGRWLIRELDGAGHEAVGAPPSGILDIVDRVAVAALVRDVAPDAIAHLAGISFAPDARRDPAHALAVNEGGTEVILAAALAVGAPILIVSSADVYGIPDPADLPLTEAAPLRAEQPYGRSKVAEEHVARAFADRLGLAVVRPFNHAGPGQRPDFVVPALAGRVVAAGRAGGRSIRAGNVDVRRDFSDVRDIVVAYRLILERLMGDGFPGIPRPPVFNLASGRAVAIREIALRFAALAGMDLEIVVDPELVRATDPPEIRGDASRIARELGWRPVVPLETTLRDVFDDVVARAAQG